MNISKRNNRNGIALVMVIGLVAIIVPVLYLLSQMGTSQTKLAFKYHENLLTETTAFSGSNAGISRLRGNLRGYQNLTNQLIGEETYSLNLRPTGKGFFEQDLYFLLANSKIKNHHYALMAEVEQFNPQPSPPVLIIARDYWNTVEPYEIDQVADVLSMQNDRGIDLLRLDETREYEKNATPSQYSSELRAKSTMLPSELVPDWSEAVENLTSEKLSM